MTSAIPPVTYQISPEVECIGCGAMTPTDIMECAECGNVSLKMDVGEFFGRVFAREIVDMRQGGLVLGRPGIHDDIPLFDFRAKNVAVLAGLMHGMEYIMSTSATNAHFDRLVEINSEKGDAGDLEEIALPLFGNVFDTNQFKPLKGVSDYAGGWVDRQFIINGYATKKHFEELVEMNSLPNE